MAMENGITAVQKDERPFKERYAEFKENVDKRFREAHQKNEAFYQIKPEFIKMPVAGLAGKDGKRHPFQKENAAILMQSALDKGLEDTRWISAKQLSDNQLFVKKGEKATVLVARNATTHEPNRMISYFNVSQLAESSQKKVPEAGPSRFRDSIAKKMAEYLKDKISLDKGADLSEQFAAASQYGYEETQKIDRQWSDKRIAAIDAVNLQEPAETADIKLMQEAKRIRANQPEAKNFMYLATVEVLKEGKFDQKAVAEALNKVSPTPTGLNFDKNYGQRTVEFAMKNDRTLNRERMLSASR